MRARESVIVAIGEWSPSGTPLTLDCGHVLTGVNHMTFYIGSRVACPFH